LSFDSSEDDLTDLFSNLKISKIRLVRDRESERSKGFGYVEFDDLESLKGALELSGESVQGRNIRVNIAEPRK
jgi:RNA recognition motif-containing protein